MKFDDLPDIILTPMAIVLLIVIGTVYFLLLIFTMFLWGSWKHRMNDWLENLGW